MVGVTGFFEGLAQQESRFLLAAGTIVVGLLLGLIVGRVVRRVLRAAGIDDAVETTPFERSARQLGTSTVDLLGTISALFIIVASVVLALYVGQFLNTDLFLARLTGFLPGLFIAALAIIFGLIVGDKAGVMTSERLKGVKLPEVSIIPNLVKYSIFYIASLIALSQVGVATGALLVLLAAYAFALVLLTAVALRELLSSAAAGMYLLLTEPYSIGDEIAVGDRQGIVQEMDVFVTRIEDEEKEYIVPNSHMVRDGVARVRN
jgi:small-conductance mechanosensitive channel